MLTIICIRLPGTRDIRFFQIQLFFTSIWALPITFATKLCSQRNGQILGRIPRKEELYRGDFLFVRRKRHAEMITIRFAGWISGRIVSFQPDTDIQNVFFCGNRIRIRISGSTCLIRYFENAGSIGCEMNFGHL